MTLFDLIPLARNDDPASSHAAAAEAVNSGLVAGHERMILDGLRTAPGSTAVELADAVGLSQVQVARRLRAMVRKGLVSEGTMRECRVRRKKLLVWHATN